MGVAIGLELCGGHGARRVADGGKASLHQSLFWKPPFSRCYPSEIFGPRQASAGPCIKWLWAVRRNQRTVGFVAATTRPAARHLFPPNALVEEKDFAAGWAGKVLTDHNFIGFYISFAPRTIRAKVPNPLFFVWPGRFRRPCATNTATHGDADNSRDHNTEDSTSHHCPHNDDNTIHCRSNGIAASPVAGHAAPGLQGPMVDAAATNHDAKKETDGRANAEANCRRPAKKNPFHEITSLISQLS